MSTRKSEEKENFFEEEKCLKNREFTISHKHFYFLLFTAFVSLISITITIFLGVRVISLEDVGNKQSTKCSRNSKDILNYKEKWETLLLTTETLSARVSTLESTTKVFVDKSG